MESGEAADAEQQAEEHGRVFPDCICGDSREAHDFYSNEYPTACFACPECWSYKPLAQ